MNTFKWISPLFAGALLFASVASPVSAEAPKHSSSASEIDMSQAKNFSDAVKSSTDDSITFTDGSTLFQHDDHYVAKSHKGEEFEITKVDDNKVRYKNVGTGEINYAVKETEKVQEKQGLSINAQASGDGFEYTGMVENSTDISINNAALTAGILSTLMLGGVVGKVSGLAVTVAGYYAAMYAPKAYWIEKSYTKSVRNTEAHATLTIRKDYHYYKYPDYTVFLNTVSTIQSCQPYGCGPIEFVN